LGYTLTILENSNILSVKREEERTRIFISIYQKLPNDYPLI
jgi:hypothetical protein